MDLLDGDLDSRAGFGGVVVQVVSVAVIPLHCQLAERVLEARIHLPGRWKTTGFVHSVARF